MTKLNLTVSTLEKGGYKFFCVVLKALHNGNSTFWELIVPEPENTCMHYYKKKLK